MRNLLVAVVLALGVAPASGADSTQASLRVGVEVTRQCSVASTASSRRLDVRCTRDAAAHVQTRIDDGSASLSPLVALGPGVVGTSVSAGSAPARPRVVTLLF
jgi:hypothetical protein